jgi:N-acetylglucosaminyldiphosphoundecaprenol N-acetyl-beta-D-mannosaminyltransferase
MMEKRLEFLGVSLDCVGAAGVNEYIVKFARDKNKYTWVGNLNVHAVNLASKSRDLCHIFNKANLTFCDGMGLSLCLKVFGIGRVEQVTYNQWFHSLLERLYEEDLKVYFLGDTPEVILSAFLLCEDRWPGMVIGYHSGYFDFSKGESLSDEEQLVIDNIEKCHADVLVVGMGMPRQEHFINKNILWRKGGVVLNGGACFKFLTGEIKSAPTVISKYGFEWAYRLFLEPRRLWKRYLIGIPMFISNLFFYKIKEIVKGYK